MTEDPIVFRFSGPSAGPCSREKFDYTKWQREHYDAMENGAFRRNAAEYAKAHPYTGNAERL